MKKLLITMLIFVLFGCFLPTFVYADEESEREHCRILLLNISFACELQKKCGYRIAMSGDKANQIIMECLLKLEGPDLKKETWLTPERQKEITKNMQKTAENFDRRAQEVYKDLLKNFNGNTERACRAGFNLSGGWVEDLSNRIIIERK